MIVQKDKQKKQKIPVFQTIKISLSTCWRNKGVLAQRLAVLLLITLLLTLVQFYFVIKEGSVLKYTLSIINLLLLVLIAVNCHRIVLLGKKSVPAYGVIVPGLRELKYLLWLVGIVLTVMALVYLTVTNPNFVTETGEVDASATKLFKIAKYSALIILFVIGAPIAYLYVRLLILLPAIAADKPLQIANAWRVTQGNGLRLLLILFFITLLALLFTALLPSQGLVGKLVMSLFDFILAVLVFTTMTISFQFFFKDSVQDVFERKIVRAADR